MIKSIPVTFQVPECTYPIKLQSDPVVLPVFHHLHRVCHPAVQPVTAPDKREATGK